MQLLNETLELDARRAAADLRALPDTGALELFGNERIKVHDAIRMVGLSYLVSLGPEFEVRVNESLCGILSASIQRDWSVTKLALLIRLLGQLGKSQVLVQFATDELFHEMGVWPEIEPFLISVAAEVDGDPITRLWALDGLAFNDLRDGHTDKALDRIEAMGALLEANELGADEWLAWAMKRMLALSLEGEAKEVIDQIDAIEKRLPTSAMHSRIFRYNRAVALFKLGAFEAAAEATDELIKEYYVLIGITPHDVMARNPEDLRPLLKKRNNLDDDLKHLADTLDLHAQALNRSGHASPFGRIHAMKFYQLANAPQSLVRVGQDLVDEFIEHNDFEGARQIIEQNLLPIIQGMGLVSWVIPVRSQYAVVLAYCREFDAAETEMARLTPYEQGLSPEIRRDLIHQRALIARIRRVGPPSQIHIEIPESYKELRSQRRTSTATPEKRTKVGRNERCPCGSGRKYKHCHGR